MKFVDYSPPALPTLEQQRDALQKGLGRAMQWALTQRLNDEPLLKACLQDQRFDSQVNSSRTHWLWQMIQVVGATQRFRVPILHACHELSDERNADQLCELAQRYAETGDEAFRQRLYEIVEQKPIACSPWLGETELVALDGERGFLLAAKVRGRQLVGREWEWDDSTLIHTALERLGEEHVHRLLEETSDEEISRFRDSWRRDEQQRTANGRDESHQQRLAQITVEEAIRAAEQKGGGGLLRGWGKQASVADLKTVLQRLWVEQEPSVIANLLRIFSARALPDFDPRLIALCQHHDESVRRRAFGAMEPNAHPLVRELALGELAKGVHDGSVVALFTHNYQADDEDRILEAMEFSDDADERHWLLMDVITVLEKNAKADSSRLGVIAYAETPCEHCRLDAARLLFKQQVAPDWLIEECRYNPDEDWRTLVGKSVSSVV